MYFGIVESDQGLSEYIGEILRAWGVRCVKSIAAQSIATLDPAECPVLIVPAGVEARHYMAFAERGGRVICFLPPPEVERAAELSVVSEISGPLSISLCDLPVPGLAGESLPIVGRAVQWNGDQAHALAFVFSRTDYSSRAPAIVELPLQSGRIICFCFDLARSVMMLRQGDPQHQEHIPTGDVCMRASHLACDHGGNDCGWLPFADLLGRLLVELVMRLAPIPTPVLDVPPAGASGIVLFSGDEDGASVEERDRLLSDVCASGGRMTLYIIPDFTHSTSNNLEHWRIRMDFGPHPNVRTLDGSPIATRLSEYRKQIEEYRKLFGSSKTIRNHSLTWAGYTDSAACESAEGMRMDANFLAGATYMRTHLHTPYGGFGGALPLRFCRLGGRLIELYQQPTHIEDDVEFGNAAYSAKLSVAQFETIIKRMLDDQMHRFHLPIGFNFHPSNWSKFSRPHGMAVLEAAAARQIPVWSFDQWEAYWSERDSWNCTVMEWSHPELRMQWEGSNALKNVCLLLPSTHQGAQLKSVKVNGNATNWTSVLRAGAPLGHIVLPTTAAEIVLRYGN